MVTTKDESIFFRYIESFSPCPPCLSGEIVNEYFQIKSGLIN